MFSIIIPTYNRSSFIAKTIDSVLNQTFENFELIIVDDGSTDDTIKVVNQFNDKRLRYYYKQNEERGAARNYGINKASGEFITFLDSDDLFYKNHLQVAFKFIKKHPNVKIFFQQYDLTKANVIKELPYCPQSKIVNEELVKIGNFMSCHGVFLSSEIVKKYKFNENPALSGSEDYEFWLRLAARFKIHYSSEVTSTLVEHNNRSVITVNPDALILRKKLMINYLFEDIKFIKKYNVYLNLIKANSYLYIALHLSLVNFNRKETLNYLFKSVYNSYKVLFRKSFYVTVFNVFFRD